ncbi:unnamed protein product [Clavelina lepadiformis]|uniref:Uncharacterized protein n=1 Tax=Clavelina lepadiformis TaxID=159417 RepID=A0ABP0H3I2_CLALP
MAIKPIPHFDQLPVPVFTSFHDDSDDDDEDHDVIYFSSEASAPLTFDGEFVTSQTDSKAHSPFSQAHLNDLVRDLDLPKNAAELFTCIPFTRKVLVDFWDKSYIL